MVASTLLSAESAAPGYVELHLHSNFSLLEGASHPKELIERAVELGYTALALTDHDNLHAALAFGRTCREKGIKPITGVELTYAVDPENGNPDDRFHLTLLARTREGYAHLCRLVSYAHGHHLSTQAARERRRRDPVVARELLARYAGGVICLTGCRHGEVSRSVDKGETRDAARVLEEFCAWYGRDNVYVELQNNLVAGDRRRLRELARLAEQCEVPVVATGNVHYHIPERHRLQDALVAIKHRGTLASTHRHRRPNSEFYLRDQASQQRRLAPYPQALATTMEIAARCEFDITEDLGYRLPSPPLPDGKDTDSQLAALCEAALGVRYPAAELPAASARLNEELGLIKRHGLGGFFLIYHEVMQLAEEVAKELRSGTSRAALHLPPGRGRGSSVGSIVCYLIGLSHIDPIRNKLFLGRFLDDEMASLPDIDLDFPRDIRARLFERVYERWGKDHAAIVGLFPTYRIRSAVRDLGRALGLPERELDRLAKFAEGYGSAGSVEDEMRRIPQFADLVDKPGWRDLIALAAQLAGFPRHLSQHVGGVVISSEPLINAVPIEPAAWPGRYICHWDKDSIDDARMVKIDFLGLGMLSLVEECLELIEQQDGEAPDLSRIDIKDKRIYDRICQGDTIGVFQIESRAQAGMLPRLQPRNLDDLAVQVAIVRPGPIGGGAVHPFLKRREIQRQGKGEYVPEYQHKTLKECLKETLGVVIYQEQVSQVAMAMARFTSGEAERFRRAMGRNDWSEYEAEYRQRFITGSLTNGVDEATAIAVFTNLAGFAEFGFPKSHATAFALLAYQSAYLKEYHPVEFYAALYNNYPMGFYPPHVITNDAKRHGIVTERPDINRSMVGCEVEDQTHLRIGLRFVQGIGIAAARHVVKARERGGEFRSLFDTMQRAGLPREAMENLIRVGAFDGFGIDRRQLLWQLGLLRPESAATWRRATQQLQLDLPSDAEPVVLRDVSDYQRMADDYAVIGMSPDVHPMAFLRRDLPPGVRRSGNLDTVPPGSIVDVAGLVVCRQRPMTAAGVVFLALEDEDGLSNVMVPSDLYERERQTIRGDAFLRIRVRVEARHGVMPMLHAQAVTAIVPPEALATPAGKAWC